jgi:hypothetical protein
MADSDSTSNSKPRMTAVWKKSKRNRVQWLNLLSHTNSSHASIGAGGPEFESRHPDHTAKDSIRTRFPILGLQHARAECTLVPEQLTAAR